MTQANPSKTQTIEEYRREQIRLAAEEGLDWREMHVDDVVVRDENGNRVLLSDGPSIMDYLRGKEPALTKK